MYRVLRHRKRPRVREVYRICHALALLPAETFQSRRSSLSVVRGYPHFRVCTLDVLEEIILHNIETQLSWDNQQQTLIKIIKNGVMKIYFVPINPLSRSVFKISFLSYSNISRINLVNNVISNYLRIQIISSIYVYGKSSKF